MGTDRPKTRPALARAALALSLMAVGACASQTEMARLRQEVADLRQQLAHEKQRQAEAAERLKRANAKAGQAAP